MGIYVVLLPTCSNKESFSTAPETSAGQSLYVLAKCNLFLRKACLTTVSQED